jgi:uncharacterized SAM-binding protein YcdF (DUF218 family)
MLDFLMRQILALMEPVGLLWLVLLIFCVVLFRGRQRGPGLVAGGMAAIVTLCGGTDFPGWLLRGLEKPWVGLKIDSLPVCDAVVVLGGGGEPSRYEMHGLHFTKAGDRMLMGLELMRIGKAATLCLGGGGAELDGRVVAEAEVVRAWMSAWGLPANAEVVSFGLNRNTREEAEKTAAIARSRGWKRVLLVTSAFHMNRASATFRTLGVDVVPAPCNFLTSISTSDNPIRFTVPGWQGFEKIDIWFHEVVGTRVYKTRGWIKE